MRRAVLVALLAGPAAAGPLPEGCFVRAYDAAHLAAEPRQTVERLAVRLAPYEQDGTRWAEALVEARFRGDPEPYRQWLHCWVEGDGLSCGVDCDGGIFVAEARADGVLLTTAGFVVAGGCGDVTEDPETGEIVEPPVRWVRDEGAGETRFRLHAAPLAACPGP